MRGLRLDNFSLARWSAHLVLPFAMLLGGCFQPAPRPNVLLITLDTTRADHLGCYGHPGAPTPNIDALAASATLYERGYATSSWTLASHASLFTGLLPMQHGAQSVPGAEDQRLGYGVRHLGDSFSTLAEILKSEGYRTGAVVAGPALARELGVAQGFDHYVDEIPAYVGERAQQVADHALEWLRKGGPEPWFLFLNFFDPHLPYRPPPPHDEGLGPPAETDFSAAMTRLRPLLEGLKNGAAPISVRALEPAYARTFQGQLDAYLAEIRYMDFHVGRVLDAAERAGSDTMIVITGDHGESFGEHYFVSHGAHLYEDNVRVPLIIKRPNQARGERKVTAAQNHRVPATILSELGLAVPAAMAPALAADRPDETPAGEAVADPAEEPVVLQVHRSEANVATFGSVLDRDLVAMISEDHKLIRSTTGARELYDLASDPEELVNLANSAPEVLSRLEQRLDGVIAARPPLFDATGRASLSKDTAARLKELGYLDGELQ